MSELGRDPRYEQPLLYIAGRWREGAGGRKLPVLNPADESTLAERRARLGTFGSQDEVGWLRVYQRTVEPVHKGAVLRR